jgi:hypothetical protein
MLRTGGDGEAAQPARAGRLQPHPALARLAALGSSRAPGLAA